MNNRLIILRITILLLTVSLTGCIENTEKYAEDADGDGYFDEIDDFPNDDTEWLDSDDDGIGNNADFDDDNDGYLDDNDYLPYKDAKIQITLDKFKVIDEVDTWPDDSNKSQVYFEIYINNKYVERVPDERYFYEVELGKIRNISWQLTYDVPDNLKTHMISIRMYDSDEITYDQLDIDGHDISKDCTVVYYITTEQWIGDDGDGITDGSEDGTQYSDDDDAYLEYEIKTI